MQGSEREPRSFHASPKSARWVLKMLYLLNEVAPGGDPTKFGAVDVFPSRAAVESHLEPWYADETYLLLGGDARRRVLNVENGKIRLTESEDGGDYSAVLKELLVAHLEATEDALRHKKSLGDAPGVDFRDLSVDSLLKLALLLS